MTRFIHVEQPLTHAGVDRVEAAIHHLSGAGKRLKGKGSRVLAALLLGALVLALIAVAERIVAEFADGALLLGWVVLWGLSFVAMALLADTARSLSLRVWTAWGRARRAANLHRRDVAHRTPKRRSDRALARSILKPDADGHVKPMRNVLTFLFKGTPCPAFTTALLRKRSCIATHLTQHPRPTAPVGIPWETRPHANGMNGVPFETLTMLTA